MLEEAQYVFSLINSKTDMTKINLFKKKSEIFLSIKNMTIELKV